MVSGEELPKLTTKIRTKIENSTKNLEIHRSCCNRLPPSTVPWQPKKVILLISYY